jgi:hypothetical protein
MSYLLRTFVHYFFCSIKNIKPWKLVASPFHYEEKGDENDATISCSVSATLFFALFSRKRDSVAKISQNFVYLTIQNFAKVHK